MRRAPNGESYWSCTTPNVNDVKFYDVTLAAIGGDSKTLHCAREGMDKKIPYVQCDRIRT